MRLQSAGLAAVIAVTAIILKIIIEGQKRRTKDTDQGSIQSEKVLSAGIVGVEAMNDTWNAEEKEHRKKEEVYWRRSIHYSVISLCAAVVAAGCAFAAFFETRRQANIADEGNRPWLEVNDIGVGGLSIIASDTVGGQFTFSVRNIGRSPATSVYIRAVLDAPKLARADPDEYAASLCRPKRHTVEFKAKVVFPDHSALYGVDLLLDSQNLKDAFAAAGLPYQGRADLRIAGCLLYKDGAGATRRTSFFYRLNKEIDLTHIGAVDGIIAKAATNEGGYAD